MVSIALCDDEKIFLSHYEDKIKSLSQKLKINLEIIKFTSGESLLFYLEDYPTQFDIIYLDILMNTTNGIDIGMKIKEINPSIQIIFLTSSESYVYDAFSVSPVNYLIKDRDSKKFDEVFKLAIKNVNESFDKDVFIHETRAKKLIIPYTDIVYFEVYKRIIIIHLKNRETIQIYKALNELEFELEKKKFVRAHRSYLVNMQYIKNITNQSVNLKTEEEVPLGRKYITIVRESLNDYLFGGVINDI
ncbi:LytR/AlgR family response regulator transcription factor [Haploplasma axanthum]|uniref:Sensory transduction protein lytR n=1 Tax=Haploplasma axanthum TaxID=29552 RepID=A0A449BBQ4_HAPAX|nr:LytTR family DNA-binding domain-containing protein [Haploplasma axanthum]VEU79866.1 Sensory transduction protein lytR [Haploplasma axanthum]